MNSKWVLVKNYSGVNVYCDGSVFYIRESSDCFETMESVMSFIDDNDPKGEINESEKETNNR